MEKINKTIGANLKNLRTSKGYTLDKVSYLTSVSKSMLGQIERGESTPTVTTLWKICNGLKISFSSLMEENSNDTIVISKKDIQSLNEDENKYNIYTYVPFNAKRKFETFLMELEPYTLHSSQPHNEGVEEYVIVTNGSVEITVDSDTYKLGKNDMLRFNPENKHSYHNPNNSISEAIILIVYP